MSAVEFSYRPLLQELTEVINGQQLDPYEAYYWLYQQQSRLGLHPQTYLSSSITSGGHARDNSLEMHEVVARNTESARLLAEQLAMDRQIDPKAALEPVFVGKTHWHQAQFMEFWLTAIGGFDFTPGYVARDVDNLRAVVQQSMEQHEVDVDVMTSKASAQTRAAEYFKMSTAFAALIKQNVAATPIESIVRLIDTDMSLGSQTERAFARQIGSKVLNVCLVQPAESQALAEVNRRLAQDTARLISFGATVFDTLNNKVRLILAEEVA